MVRPGSVVHVSDCPVGFVHATTTKFSKDWVRYYMVLTDNAVSNPRNVYHLYTKTWSRYDVYNVHCTCHVDAHKSNHSNSVHIILSVTVYLFIHYIFISRLWRRRDGERNM